MDIDYLIDRLEALITSGKRVPLSNRVMVDEQECLDLIDQMRAVIPEEVKAAKRTLLDRERILSDAEEGSRQLVQHAERERDLIISREGLMAETERQRDEILSEAGQEAFELRHQAQDVYDEAVSQTQEMREGANNYTMQVLQELDNLLSRHLNMVRNGLQSFQHQAQNYQEQIEEYQRQNRGSYTPGPPPADPQSRPPLSGSNQRSQTQPPAANASSTPAQATRSGTGSLDNRRDSPPPTERRPAGPPSNSTAAAGGPGNDRNKALQSSSSLPERRSPLSASNSGSTRGVNPVPKPSPPKDEDFDLEDDEAGLDDDFFNTDPGSSSGSSAHRPGTPGSGPLRPNSRNDR